MDEFNFKIDRAADMLDKTIGCLPAYCKNALVSLVRYMGDHDLISTENSGASKIRWNVFKNYYFRLDENILCAIPSQLDGKTLMVDVIRPENVYQDVNDNGSITS